MNQNCKDCKKLPDLKPQILKTDNWVVWLPSNQAWLGRVCIHLRHHKESLSDLNETQWQEYIQLVRKLEPAYKKAFGADPINWVCNMNNAFREDPAHPHVHWHAFPRYKKAPTFEGIVFEDALYGEHYDPHAKKILDDETVEKIAAKLTKFLD